MNQLTSHLPPADGAPSPHAADVERAGFLGWLVHALPTAGVLIALAGIGYWGHHTDWKFVPRKPRDKRQTDWCPLHGVAQSECIECNAGLLPRPPSFQASLQTVSGQDVAKAEAAVEEAKIHLMNAEQALANLGLPTLADDEKKLPAEQLARRVQFVGIPEALSRTFDPKTASGNLIAVTARQDGMVVTSEARAGEAADPTKVLFLVADTRSMTLTLDVRLEDAQRIAAGQTVSFRPDGGQELVGQVAWLSTAVDEKTRTVKVRAEMPNPDGRLRAKTFGTGRVVLRQESQAILVPSEALHWEGDCHVVFVRDKDFDRPDAKKVFHVRKVVPGAKSGDKTEIIAGVLPGELIATRGSGILRDFPGQRIAFSQPIELRMNEMISGVRSDLGIKLFGDDYKILAERAADIERILKSIPGNEEVNVEQVTGQPVLEIKVKQDEIARYGVPAKAVLDIVYAVGTLPVGEIVEDQFRFPLVVRLPERDRANAEAIGQTLIATPTGERIPLSRLASIQVIEGPSTITRDWGQRRMTITANVENRDLVGFVDEAKEKLRAVEAKLPPGGRYRLEWGGQFENYERASLRLAIVFPVMIVLILGLLYITYHNIVDSLRVLTGIPFGWVGGIIALWLRDMPFSISAAIGFIALSGVAVLDDTILISYVRQLRRRGLPVHDAVRQAALTRLRPVLMTTLVASFGFLPMALSTGQGAEVQRPLATVVIGGVIGAMVMSLLVLRVLYLIFDWFAHKIYWVLTRVCRFNEKTAANLLGLNVEHGEED